MSSEKGKPHDEGDTPNFGLHTEFYTFAPEKLAQQLPDFDQLREVGKGSMGIVYEARRRSDNKRVALKVLPPSLTLTERALARFLREGELMARIRHPSIVAVYDHGARARLHYFVMEFVDGVTLEERLTVGPLPVRSVMQIGVQAGKALQFAHDHGIVHRDVKPGNMILRHSDKEGASPRVAITDFGLARETGTGSMTESGAIVGTPMFMAPEQILGERVGAQSDVYGLGATLYTLLTGRAPFGGPTAQSVLKQVLDDEPQRPRRLRQEIPEGLEAIVLKAMDKSPARRYGTATEMAEDLERALAGERVHARLPGLGDRLLRTMRRHPAAVALIAVVLTLGGLLLVLQADRAMRGFERTLAEAESMLVQAAVGRDEEMRPLALADRKRLLDHAEAKASQVLAAAPDFGRAWFVRAKVRHRIGRWQEALADLDQSAEWVGTTAELLSYRIDTLRHLDGEHARRRLLADLNLLLAEDDSVASRCLVAEQLFDLVSNAPITRRQALIQTAERVLEGVPEQSAAAMVLLARKYEVEGDNRLAIETMRRVVERFQGDMSVHARAAELYRRQGLIQESRAEAAIVRRAGGSTTNTPGESGLADSEANDPSSVNANAPPIDLHALRSFFDEFEGVLQEIEAPDADK